MLSAALGASDLGERERAGRERLRMNGDNGKELKKIKGMGLMVGGLINLILINCFIS